MGRHNRPLLFEGLGSCAPPIYWSCAGAGPLFHGTVDRKSTNWQKPLFSAWGHRVNGNGSVSGAFKPSEPVRTAATDEPWWANHGPSEPPAGLWSPNRRPAVPSHRPVLRGSGSYPERNIVGGGGAGDKSFPKAVGGGEGRGRAWGILLSSSRCSSSFSPSGLESLILLSKQPRMLSRRVPIRQLHCGRFVSILIEVKPQTIGRIQISDAGSRGNWEVSAQFWLFWGSGSLAGKVAYTWLMRWFNQSVFCCRLWTRNSICLDRDGSVSYIGNVALIRCCSNFSRSVWCCYVLWLHSPTFFISENNEPIRFISLFIFSQSMLIRNMAQGSWEADKMYATVKSLFQRTYSRCLLFWLFYPLTSSYPSDFCLGLTSTSTIIFWRGIFTRLRRPSWPKGRLQQIQ